MEVIKVGWYSWDMLLKRNLLSNIIKKYKTPCSYRIENLYTGKQVDVLLVSRKSEDNMFYTYEVKIGY